MTASSVNELVTKAIAGKNSNESLYIVLKKITKKEALKIKDRTGYDVEGYERIIDKFAVLHTIKKHGNKQTEASRGQVFVEPIDFNKIPAIAVPENIIHVSRNKIGRTIFLYEKQIEHIYTYIEEVRTGRRQLALNTLYKRKPPTK